MSVDLKVCRKEQGIAEPGNTCLQTPGTCESCPNWESKREPCIHDPAAIKGACEVCAAFRATYRTTFGLMVPMYQRAIDTEGSGE